MKMKLRYRAQIAYSTYSRTDRGYEFIRHGPAARVRPSKFVFQSRSSPAAKPVPEGMNLVEIDIKK